MGRCLSIFLIQISTMLKEPEILDKTWLFQFALCCQGRVVQLRHFFSSEFDDTATYLSPL